MILDTWAERSNVIDIMGHDVEDLLLLIDWTTKTNVTYTLSVPVQKASGNNLEFTMYITCTNLQTYELREMWTKYQSKKGA